jgi:beta-fructofuranosidase
MSEAKSTSTPPFWPPAKENSLQPGDVEAGRRLRYHLLADPHRPTYHFVMPEGFAFPFDPNGAIHWRGRYHLFYIYREGSAHCYGHISSVDMVHWRQHPPALFPTANSPEKWIFSGNCLVNREGEATLFYHGYGAGNCVAVSSDELLEHWRKLKTNPVVANPTGSEAYDSWDPYAWLDEGVYYAVFGGEPAGGLPAVGALPRRLPKPPERPQKPASLFKAADLDRWQYVGPFLHHDFPEVAADEDLSCPDFFPLGDKWVLLCISHSRGARYYIGTWRNDQFHPESHGRMSWVDNLFISPRSVLTPDGRRVMWAWIFDQRDEAAVQASGWSGEMSLPRELSLAADATLRIAPIAELEQLRYNPRSLVNIIVRAGEEFVPERMAGNAIELRIEIEPQGAARFGVKVCRSPAGEEETLISYDVKAGVLSVDTTRASVGPGPRNVEAAPFRLGADERLVLRVFVDRSVVEAFANERQAVVRRIYPFRPDSVGVSVFAEGGPVAVRRLDFWQMAPSNPN